VLYPNKKRVKRAEGLKRQKGLKRLKRPKGGRAERQKG